MMMKEFVINAALVEMMSWPSTTNRREKVWKREKEEMRNRMSEVTLNENV